MLPLCREFTDLFFFGLNSFYARSDYSQGNQAEKVFQGMTDEEESGKEMFSISKGKHLDNTEEISNHPEESDGQAKSNIKAEVFKDLESTPQDDKKRVAAEESSSEDKEVDESSKANKDVSDSEGNEEVDVRKPSRNSKKPRKKSSNPVVAEMSEDEPLVLPLALHLIHGL